jgi:uncharacterized protein YjbI with pentapeptide repeats
VKWGTRVAARILNRMTRPDTDRPTPPRLPPDLLSEPDLRLTAGADFNCVTIQADFSDCDLEGLLVEDSRIVQSSFTAADLNRLRLVDVLVEGSDFSGADMQEASFTRVTFRACRMSGALLPRSRMRDVTFSEVRLDGVNFRMTEGERVVFDHVNLERGEFHSADLKSTRFFDCNLSGADVSQAKLPGARFHGSVLLDIKGSEYLRDVVIDSAQVLRGSLLVSISWSRTTGSLINSWPGVYRLNRATVLPSRPKGAPSALGQRSLS